VLVFRNEDLDPQRARQEFVRAMLEDLRWLGLVWDEGPDVGGPCSPYTQSGRREFYLRAWRRLRDGGFIYPCACSRKDLAQAANAPHESGPGSGGGSDPGDNDDSVYPGRCRARLAEAARFRTPEGVNWRFRVPDGEQIAFQDGCQGPQAFTAGADFGDFLVWRRDDVPAYQLAVVVDDAEMRITEVVRGADLLKSTARQILLLRALGAPQPEYFHCDLVRDENGRRLAKQHDALSLRHLRETGMAPAAVIARFSG
jgi:glutamyl-tRNA synthetase